MKTPIIRLLGGARVQAQQNLQQEPCSITGLSRLTGVAEADLVVLWWDNGIADLPGEHEPFGDALSAGLRHELQECVRDSCAQYRNDFLAKLKESAAQENLSAEEKALRQGEYIDTVILKRPIVVTGLKAPATLLKITFAEFLGNVWAAVRHGGIAVVVIPSKPQVAAAVSPADSMLHPGVINPVPPGADAAASVVDAIQRFGVHLPAKPEAATVISPAAIIEKFGSLIPATPDGATNFMITDVIPQLGLEWDIVPQPVMVPANILGASDPVRIMAGKLIELVDYWPFRVGIRTTEKSHMEEQGELTIGTSVVRFCPAISTNQGNARALLLMLGQGALLVTPPPRSQKDLVQTFLKTRTAAPSLLAPSLAPHTIKPKVAPPATPSKVVAVKSKKHRQGRKPAPKAERDQDKALANKWESAQKASSGRLTIAEFARDQSVDVRIVKKALDNHRKRQAAIKLARVQRPSQ